MAAIVWLFFLTTSGPLPGHESLPASLPPSLSDTGPESIEAATFQPSIAVIVGVLTTMCSLTFLLLIYAKHCKTSSAGLLQTDQAAQVSQAPQRTNGIDQVLIQALPTFVFSALKGNKDGLECAVCLSKYDECEVLRLLPKCKHAFHVDCVDTWLLGHSTCPLCRCDVSSEDLLLVDEILSSRKSIDASVEPVEPLENPVETSSLQFYVQQGSHDETACSTMPLKNGMSPSSHKTSIDQAVNISSSKSRRLSHRIIVSDVVLQHRWSDLVPADVLFLSSQTLFCLSERISTSNTKALVSTEIEGESFHRSSSKGANLQGLSTSKRYSTTSTVADGSAISFLRRAFSLSRADGSRRFLFSPSMRSMSEATAFKRVASPLKKEGFDAGKDPEAYQLGDVEKSRKWLSIAKITIARLMRK